MDPCLSDLVEKKEKNKETNLYTRSHYISYKCKIVTLRSQKHNFITLPWRHVLTPKYLKLLSTRHCKTRTPIILWLCWLHKKRINASISIVSGQVPLALKRWNRSMQQEGSEFIKNLHNDDWLMNTWIEKRAVRLMISTANKPAEVELLREKKHCTIADKFVL